MKAVILAAGYGNRMRPLTDAQHKTLLEVGGRTIIGRILDCLESVGVTRVAVVTGYRAEELEAHLLAHHPRCSFEFVRNERYRETNNIFSLALALEAIEVDEDILLIESDLVCEPAVFERIARSPHPNVALVDHYRMGMDGTVVTVVDGVVTSVLPPHTQGGDFTFRDKYKTLNIYKLSKEFCSESFKHLLTYYAKNFDDSCYYELILGIVIYLQRAVIRAEIIDKEVWAEIDDPNDLRLAEFIFHPEERRRILDETSGGYWPFEEQVTDFCFIRNMYFPNASMLAEMRDNLVRLVHNYGSRQDALDRKLALFLLCNPARVHVLNGLSQLFPFLAARYAGKRVLIPSPTFGEYPRSFPNARVYRDRPGMDLAEIEAQAAEAEVIVFVNPNNPSGFTLPSDWILRFARQRPDKTIIVDESFIAFSSQPSMIPWLEAEPADNVMVLTSLSKTLGVPGIRLGHIYTTNAKLAADVAAWLPIWSLNSVAEHFLEIILKHRRGLAESIQQTIADREDFAAELGALSIVDKVHPSGGDYLLVTLRAGVDADALANDLLRRHRLYVKDATGKLADGRGHLRLAVRLPHENRRVCEAIAQLGVR
jgi:histidinol-phosphate/aromatic aminotransferase/cobyric acid decarboxylase-like protein/choline kinase